MGKITNEMIGVAYEIGKAIFEKNITRLEGIAALENIGMKESSAHDYIYFYSNLIQGKLITRNSNTYATRYYLQKIYDEKGGSALKNALLALSQHFDYYEDVSNTSIKKRREVYNEFYTLIKENYDKAIYPDEVNPSMIYSEGKTKQILVNSYERNPIARKKCIEHFGYKCQVCELSFEEKYGVVGRDFIHVHHIIEIHTIGKEYSINPITDLIPVCPNCHSMLHKKEPPYTIGELKKLLLN